MKKNLLLATYSIIFLSACGGGGSSSNSTTAPVTTANQPLAGSFLDSQVQGLRYVSDTQEGTTNETGTFEYMEGETVEFFIGDLSIGRTLGSDIVTPLNLSDDLGAEYAINLLRLLQTLDSDGIPANGIELKTTIDNSNTVDLTQNLDDFESDDNTSLFIAMNASTNILVSTESAISHFQSTLDSVESDYQLELAGTEWISIITAGYCEEGIEGGFKYSFTETDIVATGADEFISQNFTNCSLGGVTTETGSYSEDPSFPLSCGPTCTYNDLNEVISGTDADGREFITTVSHIPNSGTVTFTKDILSDPSSPPGFVPHTFQEVTTLIPKDYRLDLTGTEWASVITADYCEEGIEGGFEYTFTETEITIAGTDEFISQNFTNCSLGEVTTETGSYSEDPNSPLSCGPTCTYNDLNKVISGTDADGREFITTVKHIPNSNKITSIKQILTDSNISEFKLHTFREVITLTVVE